MLTANIKKDNYEIVNTVSDLKMVDQRIVSDLIQGFTNTCPDILQSSIMYFGTLVYDGTIRNGKDTKELSEKIKQICNNKNATNIEKILVLKYLLDKSERKESLGELISNNLIPTVNDKKDTLQNSSMSSLLNQVQLKLPSLANKVINIIIDDDNNGDIKIIKEKIAHLIIEQVKELIIEPLKALTRHHVPDVIVEKMNKGLDHVMNQLLTPLIPIVIDKIDNNNIYLSYDDDRGYIKVNEITDIVKHVGINYGISVVKDVLKEIDNNASPIFVLNSAHQKLINDISKMNTTISNMYKDIPAYKSTSIMGTSSEEIKQFIASEYKYMTKNIDIISNKIKCESTNSEQSLTANSNISDLPITQKEEIVKLYIAQYKDFSKLYNKINNNSITVDRLTETSLLNGFKMIIGHKSTTLKLIGSQLPTLKSVTDTIANLANCMPSVPNWLSKKSILNETKNPSTDNKEPLTNIKETEDINTTSTPDNNLSKKIFNINYRESLSIVTRWEDIYSKTISTNSMSYIYAALSDDKLTVEQDSSILVSLLQDIFNDQKNIQNNNNKCMSEKLCIQLSNIILPTETSNNQQKNFFNHLPSLDQSHFKTFKNIETYAKAYPARQSRINTAEDVFYKNGYTMNNKCSYYAEISVLVGVTASIIGISYNIRNTKDKEIKEAHSHHQN